MPIKPEHLTNFSDEERKFIETLDAQGKLKVTDDENAELPRGITHVLLIERGRTPRLIRKRFA